MRAKKKPLWTWRCAPVNRNTEAPHSGNRVGRFTGTDAALASPKKDGIIRRLTRQKMAYQQKRPDRGERISNIRRARENTGRGNLDILPVEVTKTGMAAISNEAGQAADGMRLNRTF